MKRAVEQEQDTMQKLPDECLEIILSHINDNYDWEAISLTCKKFLTLSNSCRVSLSFGKRPSVKLLKRVLKRYPNLRKLRITSAFEDLDYKTDRVITKSNLNLEELDLCFNGSFPALCFEDLGSRFKLKVLKLCCPVSNACLIRIAHAFPFLEEIRTRDAHGHPLPWGKVLQVDDGGIHYLSSKLKRLRTVNISHDSISDKSLVSLASNCAFLEHLTLGSSFRVTENGFSFLVKNSPHLKSLVITDGVLRIGCFGDISPSNLPNNLQTLKFRYSDISDEFLYSIAEAQISLTHLHVERCKGYSFTGIWKLLNSYRSLKTLLLSGVDFLTNEHIDKLSPILHSLTTMQLWACPLLSDSAFVMLTQKYPRLCHIDMSRTGLGKEDYKVYKNGDLTLKNFAVKSLTLAMNKYLSTSTLHKLLSICPKVETLSLLDSFNCNDLQLDVADVLECSRELQELNISCCHLKFTRKDLEFSVIEKLTATFSDINDEGLFTLSKICPRLLHLSLTACNNVTEAGVKEVVKSCKRLRSLRIDSCKNVCTGIKDWIEISYPSLTRRIST